MFDNTWLSAFEMTMCTTDEAQQFVTRMFDKAETTSLHAAPSHYGSTYTDALVLNFMIMKTEAICGDQEDARLNGDEIHFLRSWLESPKLPTELMVVMDEDEMDVHYYGIFTSVQPYVIDDECYGLNLQFTCNAPYGYSDEQVYTIEMPYTIDDNPIPAKIYNVSAERKEYLKPKITINTLNGTFGSNETLSIKNTSDGNKTMTITLPEGKTQMVIDCQKKIITDGDGNLLSMSSIGLTLPSTNNYNFISTDTYLFYWLSLVADKNVLEIIASTNSHIDTIEISVRYIIKSGGF